jgi:phosphoribosylaminoimidazole carboxylase (NCAIR synthetase)
MSILILNNGPLALRPYHEWLADHPGSLLLLTSAEELARNGEQLPPTDGVYAYVEAIEDYDGSGRLEARALDLAERFEITDVVACQEVDLQRAGVLREVLGVPGQGIDSAEAYRDKLVMKRLAGAAGVRVAMHAEVETAVDVLAFAREHGYPVVLKPRAGFSAIGLRIVEDEEQLLDWLATDFGDYDAAPKQLLVEAFVPGEMFHVDGFIRDGRVAVAWPSQYMYQLASFGDGDDEARLDATLDPGPLADRLIAFATAMIDALPTPGCSTFHAEIFRTPDDKLVLCEIASRNGGVMIKHLLMAMYGINFPIAWVRASVGLPVPLPQETALLRPARMAGQVLLPKRAGIVRQVPAPPEADWVENFRVWVRPGDRLSGSTSSGDYMAGMVVSAPTRGKCEQRMRQTARWLQHEIRIDSPSVP